MQMETWLSLTTYRKSLAPYPIVPSDRAPYLMVPFGHNTARLAYHSAL